jgi:hypothetical protein
MSAQPLHPSIIPKLDPEYVDFHNKHLAQIVPPHTIPWNSVTRNAVTMPGTSDPLDVRSTKDIALSKCKVRVFTPPGSRPSQGWPAYVVRSSSTAPSSQYGIRFIFYHGGDVLLDMQPSYRLKREL